MARNEKRNLLWNIFFLTIFLFSFGCFLLCLKGYYFSKPISLEKPAALKDDLFDPSLSRLNTMEKLDAYCDSFYAANKATSSYAGIISEVVRSKFFHGYSYYTASTNPLAAMISPIVKRGLSAIVLPDDIVKYPNAACSQQSIVAMELMKRGGYPVRKVTMFDEDTKLGHFAFEAYYDYGWHYFDTNQEPDNEVLKKYDRPSVVFLNEHPDIIAAAYYKKDQHLFQRLLKSSQFGPVNEKLAPVATFYQRTTKFLSNFGWLIIGIFLLARFAFLKRKQVFGIKRLGKKQSQFQHTHSQLQGREARA